MEKNLNIPQGILFHLAVELKLVDGKNALSWLLHAKAAGVGATPRSALLIQPDSVF